MCCLLKLFVSDLNDFLLHIFIDYCFLTASLINDQYTIVGWFCMIGHKLPFIDKIQHFQLGHLYPLNIQHLCKLLIILILCVSNYCQCIVVIER